jgi:hypothetical protein
MVGRVLRFVRLPLLLVSIFAVARFLLGAAGVPYAPRGNAMFSIVGLTFVSSFYFGALSGASAGSAGVAPRSWATASGSSRRC